MSDDHKAALAVGRSESRTVKRYLETLAANKPKRGRKRTADSIAKRLEKIEKDLTDAPPLQQVQLIQERMDLNTELESMNSKVDMTAVEEDFVAVAAAYSERKGISYAAWREIGVSAAVLKRAKISRTA